MTNVRRIPIYQLASHGNYVCTDQELGNQVSLPRWNIQLCWCLGSLWAERYQPDMVAVYRYSSTGGTAHRLGVESDGSSWPTYTRGDLLGYAFPATARGAATDLVTMTPYTAPNDPNAGYLYWNGIETYPGYQPKEVQAPQQAVPGAAFRIHAPTVIRVAYDATGQNLTLTPDVAEITRGNGAPIVWLRADGFTPNQGQQWAFAYLAFAWHATVPTGGNTVWQEARFVTRHMTPDQIVVIDNYEVDGSDMDFDYRLSIIDHESDKILTRDPKVRNGTGVGSGGTPGGG